MSKKIKKLIEEFETAVSRQAMVEWSCSASDNYIAEVKANRDAKYKALISAIDEI